MGSPFRQRMYCQIGQDIEANWRGKGKWYSAVVTDIKAEGKFEVRYKDDGIEETVTSDNIRYPPCSERPCCSTKPSKSSICVITWWPCGPWVDIPKDNTPKSAGAWCR